VCVVVRVRVYSNGIITTPALQQLARDYTAKGKGKMVLPINEIDEFMDVLSMDCNVSAMDVEEVDRGVRRGTGQVIMSHTGSLMVNSLTALQCRQMCLFS
jgi:hypothetical protein